MNSQEYIRNIIQEEFEKERFQNSKYSLRMFAAKIGLQPAALSSFLAGKRQLSLKLATKIFENLALPPKYIFELNDAFKKNEKGDQGKGLEKLQLQSSLYYLLSDPLYYSYLCLVETTQFHDDDSWASEVLESTPHKVATIKEKLLELKLLTYNAQNKLVATKSVLGSTDNIPNHSLKIRHAQNMEDAKKAIFSVDVDKRYFGFETLAFDKEDLAIVQTKINQLLDDLIWLSKKGSNKDSVYEFCVQYFPRSKDL